MKDVQGCESSSVYTAIRNSLNSHYSLKRWTAWTAEVHETDGALAACWAIENGALIP